MRITRYDKAVVSPAKLSMPPKNEVCGLIENAVDSAAESDSRIAPNTTGARQALPQSPVRSIRVMTATAASAIAAN